MPSYLQTIQLIKAISYDAIHPEKNGICTSFTLGGVAGTLANCPLNNTSACVTTDTYKSVDWTHLAAANIKNGVSVAGLIRIYQSNWNLLSGADTTAD